jgi:hypothetical protein
MQFSPAINFGKNSTCIFRLGVGICREAQIFHINFHQIWILVKIPLYFSVSASVRREARISQIIVYRPPNATAFGSDDFRFSIKFLCDLLPIRKVNPGQNETP